MSSKGSRGVASPSAGASSPTGAQRDRGSKNIRVFLRVRPPVDLELNKNHTFNNLQMPPSDPTTCQLTLVRDGMKIAPKAFHFNQCFGQKTTNKEVYNSFGKAAVDAAFDGVHGVLFVYGQTGSGKSYTITNDDPSDYGVLQQASREIWDRIAADTSHEYEVKLSYVQLYKEILTNLLDKDKGRIRLQTSSDGVVMVKETSPKYKEGEDPEAGMPCDVPVNGYEETMRLFHQGMERKEMAATNMNVTSSRSHTIFAVSITKKTRVGRVSSRVGAEGAANGPVTELHGMLYLCDLAGSERASKTGATGKILTEANSINGSLLVLGKVVAALTERKAQHAPFRESKLTRILQYALTGNGNTSIIVNCSPSDENTEETYSAILFGQRAIQIKQDAKRHEVLDYKALYLQLQADLEAKNDELIQAAVQQEVALYEAQLAEKEEQVKFAEQQNELLRSENQRLRVELGRDGGNASPRGGGGGGGEQWNAIVEELRATLKKRGNELTQMYNERAQLAFKVADKEQTAFKLAERFRAMARKYQMERSHWLQQVNDLRAENSSLRGTDFLSLNAVPQADSPKGAYLSPSSNSSAISSAGLGEGTPENAILDEQLQKANERIRDYHEDRIALLVYQEKAIKAIKFLAAENKKLGGTLFDY